jgi:SAM-dependent methyltransferase
MRKSTDVRGAVRPDYGYDAPYAIGIFGTLAVLSAMVAVAGAVSGWEDSRRLVVMMTIYCAFFTANLASFLYTTRRGKLVEWERILDRLCLRGHERVLDMGCGRGAVLTAVARRLTTGRAAGVDIWSTRDQSGNARDVTVRNATIEGVADRVDVTTGDMRRLPFADASFDLVVSSLAIHNIRSDRERRLAVAEGYRVLKPGGRLVIADIRATSQYVEALRALGAADIERGRLGWRFWWGNPIACTRLVTAAKAIDAPS